MKLKTLATYAVPAIAVGHLFSAQISFTAGNPALAADVNANFSELYNAKWTLTGADLGYTAGKIGIGTLTPAGQLDIVHSGASPFINFETYNATSRSLIQMRRGRGTSAAPAIVQNGDELGRLYFQGYDGAAFNNAAAVSAFVDAVPGAGNVPGALIFSTSPNGGFITERMRISNAGNIGIGTANPGAKFTISDSTGNITALVPNSSGTTAKAFIRIGDTGGNVLDFGGAGGSPPYPYWLQVHNENNQASNGPLLLNPNGGHVGIGVANPNGRLDVRDTSLGDGGVVAYFGEDVGGMKIRRLNVGADPDRIGFSLQQAGTDYFFWIGLDGNLHTQASLPGSANGGTIVGDQTSTRSSKQDILPFQDIDNALAKILTAKLHRFRYKNEVIGYKRQAKYHIGFMADEVHPDFMDAFGTSIDQVSVNGMLIGSVQRLNQKIESRNAEVIALNPALRQAHGDTKKAEARATKLEKQFAEQQLRLAQLEQTLSRLALRVENSGRTLARR